MALLKLTAILLGGVAAGFALLTAVYALPVAPIAHNVQLSVQSLDGSWATGEIPYEQLVKGYETTQLDNSTDANMLLAAAHESDLPLMQQVIETATYGYGGSTYAALLEYGQSGSANLQSAPAARYWHGFLVYLKPLLCFFSYMDIRMFQMAFQLLLLCAVTVGLCRRGLARYAPAFALSLLAVTPAITGFSLQFSTIYTLYLLAMLALLYRPRLLQTRMRTAAFFMIVGMATSYFDFLTYPIAAFGMPFLLSLLLSPVPTRRAGLLRGLLCLGAWAVGYFGLWAGKWVIAAAFGSDGWFVPNLMAKITERSSHQSAGVTLGAADVLGRVLGVFAKKAYLLVAATVTAAYAALLVRAVGKRSKCQGPSAAAGARPAGFTGQTLLMLLAGLLPFGWYLLASNHTYNHAFFTSRALTVTVFAAGCLATDILLRVKGGETPAVKG